VGNRRRVFVAGRGAVSGFGAGRRVLADAIHAGERAVRPRARTAAFPAPTNVAAEAPPECLRGADGEADHARVLALLAAREALEEAGAPDPRTIGLVLASTKADLSGIVGEGDGCGQAARLAQRLAADLGLAGVRAAVSTACASGLVALALAERRIARGEAERLLVIGVDALGPFTLRGFGSLSALDPEPCRPFDARRRGLSLGEGAGALLLTACESESLGVRLAGHGGANDAFHPLHPPPGGEGLTLAVRRALASAELRAGDIDVIHLHGTGTVASDASEAAGLAAAFGGRTPPAFGTKAQTGHTLGAAGLLETLLLVEALERGTAPANAGLEQPDVDDRLDLVRAPRVLPRARRGLKVACGIGGVQAALVLEA
jgi:3-oxoacyl-[acyl-carrier-protein] synthase II